VVESTIRHYFGHTFVKAGTISPVQWLLSYEAPFEDSIYPGGGAFFAVSVIVYGVDEISAFDAMTHFYFDGVSVGSVIEAGWHSLVEYSCIATCAMVALA